MNDKSSKIEQAAHAVLNDWIAACNTYGPPDEGSLMQCWPFTPRINWASLHQLKKAIEEANK